MQTEPALEVDTYPGSVVGAAQAGVALVSRALFNGVVACADAPRDAVAETLPRELRLASSEGAKVHPLLAVFGDQTRGGSRYGPWDVEWGTEYAELILAVPFASVRRTGHLANFALSMVSSYELPNLMGRLSYGYPKRFGEQERFGPVRTFTAPDDGLLFQSSVREAGAWRSGRDGDAPMLAALARIAALPWIGRRPGGQFVRSFACWTFDEAFVRPVEARTLLQPALVPALAGEPLVAPPERALEVQGMLWRLSWPSRAVV